jgi:hypothetical protein
VKASEAEIMRMALAYCRPGKKAVSLAGYPGIKYVYSLDDNVIYRNTTAAPGAHECKIIK